MGQMFAKDGGRQANSVAITKYFFTKYFTLNTFFLIKSTLTKYFVNFGI